MKTSQRELEMEKMPFTVAIKSINYLRINLTIKVQEL